MALVTRSLALSFALAVQPLVAQPAIITGTASVIDGDTVRVGAASVRLHGVDAAEAGQSCELADGRSWRCDVAATDLLVELTQGQEISCEILQVDGYGRLVSTCEIGGVDLGAALIGRGLAWAYTDYSDDYVEQEAAAREAGIGIWRGGAEPTTPAAYRADSWARAAAASPRPGCPVKGNIDRKGEKIYHTPWSAYYARTKIDTSKGEAWFCDEAEAIAAGWRPARPR